eukprot:6181595-Pleurochrysis_carterae.AAC.3
MLSSRIQEPRRVGSLRSHVQQRRVSSKRRHRGYCEWTLHALTGIVAEQLKRSAGSMEVEYRQSVVRRVTTSRVVLVDVFRAECIAYSMYCYCVLASPCAIAHNAKAKPSPKWCKTFSLNRRSGAWTPPPGQEEREAVVPRASDGQAKPASLPSQRVLVRYRLLEPQPVLWHGVLADAGSAHECFLSRNE